MLTLGAIPVVYAFDGPWWILAGWAVLVPFLQSIVMIRIPTEVVRNDATPEQMVRAFRAVKRLLFLGLTMVAVFALMLGGLWWLLALCTVFAVIGVDGKGATVLLYTVIGGITAYYTWGTWWALLGLAIPTVGALSPTTRSRRVTTRIDVA